MLNFHVQKRNVSKASDFYWMCTFANNQHDLGELGGGLEETPEKICIKIFAQLRLSEKLIKKCLKALEKTGHVGMPRTEEHLSIIIAYLRLEARWIEKRDGNLLTVIQKQIAKGNTTAFLARTTGEGTHRQAIGSTGVPARAARPPRAVHAVLARH